MMAEYPVKISPSDAKKSFPADIAILEDNKVKIFVETKKVTLLLMIVKMVLDN